METSSSSTGVGLDFFFDFLTGAATRSSASLEDGDEDFDVDFAESFFWLASSSTAAGLDCFFDFLAGAATGSGVSSEDGETDFDFTESFFWLGTELSLSLSLSLDEETACHQHMNIPPNHLVSYFLFSVASSCLCAYS
jgi:hypothetical protein